MNRREFLRNLGILVLAEACFPDIRSQSDNTNIDLQNYLKRIQDEAEAYLPIVDNLDLFDQFKNVPDKKRVEDYELYFPMYRAGQHKYQVPWFLLWLIHEQETGASTHPCPETSGYVGAMQRNSFYYDRNYVANAIGGWEFLRQLPQRYCKDTGWPSNDCEEILFAARKISEDAERLRAKDSNLDLTKSFLEAQFNYCNHISANERIAQFNKMGPILDRTWRNTKIMNSKRFRKNME